VALTSFEFFDVLVESSGSVEGAVGSVYPVVKMAMDSLAVDSGPPN
jgi:hypothetical protein